MGGNLQYLTGYQFKNHKDTFLSDDFEISLETCSNTSLIFIPTKFCTSFYHKLEKFEHSDPSKITQTSSGQDNSPNWAIMVELSWNYGTALTVVELSSSLQT